jgi:hypothetical protein
MPSVPLDFVLNVLFTTAGQTGGRIEERCGTWQRPIGA